MTVTERTGKNDLCSLAAALPASMGKEAVLADSGGVKSLPGWAGEKAGFLNSLRWFLNWSASIQTLRGYSAQAVCQHTVTSVAWSILEWQFRGALLDERGDQAVPANLSCRSIASCNDWWRLRGGNSAFNPLIEHR